MLFNYSALRGRIVEKFGTVGKFAETIGRSKTYMSSVFSHRTYLNTPEIIKWCEVLEIEVNEIPTYFFAY